MDHTVSYFASNVEVMIILVCFLPSPFCSFDCSITSFSLIKAGNKPPPTTPGKPKKATTFQEFESITSDAWDVGDDDDELLAMAAQNLNIEVVMETANKVMRQHFSLKIMFRVCRQHF